MYSGGSFRRGGRVVEGARLERVYTGNRIEGSNPSPSTIRRRLRDIPLRQLDDRFVDDAAIACVGTVTKLQ